MWRLFYVLILLASFPVSYLLAWLARDELQAGRKWFIILSAISLVIVVIISFSRFLIKVPVILTLFFIIILCLISIWKSYDKKFIKNGF